MIVGEHTQPIACTASNPGRSTRSTYFWNTCVSAKNTCVRIKQFIHLEFTTKYLLQCRKFKVFRQVLSISFFFCTRPTNSNSANSQFWLVINTMKFSIQQVLFVQRMCRFLFFFNLYHLSVPVTFLHSDLFIHTLVKWDPW